MDFTLVEEAIARRVSGKKVCFPLDLGSFVLFSELKTDKESLTR